MLRVTHKSAPLDAERERCCLSHSRVPRGFSRPQPSRSDHPLGSLPRLPSHNARLIVARSSRGSSSNKQAIVPVTKGADKLVPDSITRPVSDWDMITLISTPGAEISGFLSFPPRVGPQAESAQASTLERDAS